MARTKTTPKKSELKALREIKHQQKQTKPAIPKVALARYKEILTYINCSPNIYTHLYVIYTQNIFQTSEADMLGIGGEILFIRIYTQNIFQTSEADMLGIEGEILSVDSWGSAGTSGRI